MGFGGTAPPTVLHVPPPAPVMAGLNQQFQDAMGKAGPESISNLQDIAKNGIDVGGMFDKIKKASADQQKIGEADLMSKFAATGGSMSSDMMKQLATYNINYGAQLDQTMAKLSAESVGVRLGASQILEETFGNAAMAFAPTGQVAGGQGYGTGGQAAISGAGEAAIIGLMIASMA